MTDESCEAFEDLTLEQRDDEPGEDLSGFKMLSSGISLLINHDSSRDIVIDQSGGELWSVKNFACYLTLDPNTASPELLLSEHNRTATRVWSDHRCPDHPERFDGSPQVLCREGLLEEVYWEVEWSGGADVGVTYNSISRAGDAASCLLGHNAKSWSLECCEGSYTPCHDNKRFRASSPKPFTHRVGVYLNWPAGSLSFFSVSSDAMTLLHTFSSTFTEPLYPAFWVWGSDASVSLRQVELDWERLLQ
ncbi:neoverrucotoxin subunit alpha-like [Myripristis murdjan]|uniref:neoverrucotoxin subunit alpha-like n=1 Tax=Myripristis murdjan TaxID=586833 RepID=UPI00117627F0|nr:neoverrucotoxin subunit alpha-like [Myripristis murdjan]